MAEDPTTWAELKTSARAWLVDIETGSVSETQLEEFIAFAERGFQRRVFSPDREAALSLSVSAQSTALPSDFWGFKSPPYVDAATDVVLIRVTPGDLRATYPDATTGTPGHYAIEGENLLVGPTPSSAQTVKGTYYKTIPVLNASNTSNWLLTDHPDLYLAGTLYYAHLFLMDEARAALWGAKMAEQIVEINRAGIQRAANSGALVATHSVGHVSNITA